MRRTVVIGLVVISVIAATCVAALLIAQTPFEERVATSSEYATEQEWIVSSVVRAIVGMADRAVANSATDSIELVADKATEGAFLVTIRGRSERVRVAPADHVWAPESYAPLAASLFTRQSADDARASVDLAARTALAHLTVDALLGQNQRVSSLLQENMRSAATHEAAALVVGAFAMRESAGLFSDLRPALSRMAAHLAIAGALRGPVEEGLDAVFARAILTVLAGLQRDALAIVDAAEARARSQEDRAWSRALRLRITGDWRQARPRTEDPLVERFEYARAVKVRRGVDKLLDYIDTQPSVGEADWHRIVLEYCFSVEAGNSFTEDNVERELAETALVWSSLHHRTPERNELIRGLNDRPAVSPLQRAGANDVVSVLDWGLWAAFAQRHLSRSLVAKDCHLSNLALEEDRPAQLEEFDRSFGELTLYPIALRAMSHTEADHERALAGARKIANDRPQLLTAAAWNLLRERPDFLQKPVVFPLDVEWFTPAVPTGTAFDLDSRSLRPGSPRKPTKAQAAKWTQDMPYEHWTAWLELHRALDPEKPTLAAARRVMATVLEYDYHAVLKLVDYTDVSVPERIEAARTMCVIAPHSCHRLADLLLMAGQEADAAAAYEQWIAESRDRVGVSNTMTWIVRYYDGHGRAGRAEAIARMAAETGSARGMEVLAELRDRHGDYDAAEEIYRRIAKRYRDYTSPLAAFLIRQARREHDSAGETKAWKLLESDFPDGMPQLTRDAFPARPTDGVTPVSVAQRAETIGLKRDDVIMSVDGLRVRTWRQYQLVAKLRHDHPMTLTVWRGEKYQELSLQVPERWFGVQWSDYKARTSHSK